MDIRWWREFERRSIERRGRQEVGDEVWWFVQPEIDQRREASAGLSIVRYCETRFCRAEQSRAGQGQARPIQTANARRAAPAGGQLNLQQLHQGRDQKPASTAPGALQCGAKRSVVDLVVQARPAQGRTEGTMPTPPNQTWTPVQW
ncbi:hypothetical protein CPLU01_00153 [Colletotrichum plurivorum]|uniref:Uncharacterized protein n=1 Tax=Colletotrichum plurivorum TaxID=2175906 RepID=A0A8H6NT90_9PEZI|nr:hypothetical protein CPLU01_00153 [Colletotrichum plurivorum]